MEHLLARLELDDAPICKRIINLIFNSYMPSDKTPEVRVWLVYKMNNNKFIFTVSKEINCN